MAVIVAMAVLTSSTRAISSKYLTRRANCQALSSHCKRCQSTSTTHSAVDSSYLQNEGTIEGVWIFHRHGDRAPNRYLGSPAYHAAESAHWYSRIPPVARAAAAAVGRHHDHYAALSEHFPPIIHKSQNDGVYTDINREPFGFLTYNGMDQMRCVGKRFRQRCDRYGYNHSKINGEKRSFLEDWDLRAYSTNYLRTVTSVQCFLDGLIGYHNSVGDERQKQLLYAGGGLRRYYKDAGRHEHMHPSTLTLSEDFPVEQSIQVQVRDKKIDTLNAFDKRPKMMNDLVKNVINMEGFQRIDSNAKELADQLSEFLPGLRGAPQAFGGTPSGINWIHANDHFVCRRAHGIPLSAFSDYEGTSDEAEVEKLLESLATPVCSHLSWRFREWYACPKLVAAVAAPPFQEMLDQMIDVTRMGAGERRPFVVYSAHDVTLLALLYAIGADFLVAGGDCGGKDMVEGTGGTHSHMVKGSILTSKLNSMSSWRWWPDYSSAIAFELVRLNSGHEYGDTTHIIRVILNGRTLCLLPRLSIDDEGILKDQTPCSRQRYGAVMEGSQSQMLSLSDFAQIINVLEQSSYASTNEDDGVQHGTKIGVEGG